MDKVEFLAVAPLMNKAIYLAILLLTFSHELYGQSVEKQDQIQELPEEDVEELGELYQRAKRPPADLAERIEFFDSIAKAASAISDRNQDVPDHEKNHELLLRRVTFPAIEKLYQVQPTAENRKRLSEIAARVANNPCVKAHQIHKEKMRAEEIVIRHQFRDSQGDLVGDVEPAILDLLKKYPDVGQSEPLDDDQKNQMQFAAVATVVGAKLAKEFRKDELFENLRPVIERRYLASPGAIDLLVATGYSPVFSAEMRTLDGKEINFPEDFRGKIVVLDYWATWCGPCIASMPHIKELWEKYDSDEVVFVGVCIDKCKDENERQEKVVPKIRELVKKHDYNWIQVIEDSSKSADRLGIHAIPHVLVVGTDGKIAAYQARGVEEELLDRLLSSDTKE